MKETKAATSQTNQLKLFYTTGKDVLWITFHNQKLYWCFADPEIEVLENGSRLRRTIHGWSCKDMNGNDLDFNRLSGSLLAVQGYRSTICSVKESEYLVRKINAEPSQKEKNAQDSYKTLVDNLSVIIQTLHPKEFELLNDMVFREAGWRRTGMLGDTQEGIDIDLYSPINDERIKVQIKSKTGLTEYNKFAKKFDSPEEKSKGIFIVHTPDLSLCNCKEKRKKHVDLWLAKDVAKRCVDYGLTDWVINKAK